jgi:hypothetical protein
MLRRSFAKLFISMALNMQNRSFFFNKVFHSAIYNVAAKIFYRPVCCPMARKTLISQFLKPVGVAVISKSP